MPSEVGRGIRSSTIGRRIAALRYAHKLAGLPLPTDDERVRATLRGITAAAKKAPVTAEKLLAMVAPPGRTLAALSDRALLLLGLLPAILAVSVFNFAQTHSPEIRYERALFVSRQDRARSSERSDSCFNTHSGDV